MKALTLWQPWATLVAIGAKRLETRSWRTNYRGPLAIHAAKAFPREALQACGDVDIAEALVDTGYGTPADLPRGCIVAVVTLASVRPFSLRPNGGVRWGMMPVTWQDEAFGDCTPGRYGWLLTDVRPTPPPVACRGAMGLWTVPSEVAALLPKGGEHGSRR